MRFKGLKHERATWGVDWEEPEKIDGVRLKMMKFDGLGAFAATRMKNGTILLNQGDVNIKVAQDIVESIGTKSRFLSYTISY